MKIYPLLALALLISLPFVSAYNGWGWYSPSDLLNNEWLFFALVFMAFFAFTYFALGKSMKEAKGSAITISVIISLFIATAISQRARFYGYMGESIGGWLLVVAVILALIILAKFLIGIVGGMGFLIALWLIVLFTRMFDPYNILPYGAINPEIFNIWYFLAEPFLPIMIILTIIALIAAFNNKKFGEWFWGSNKKKTKLDQLLETY